jgi:hypothetical protein
MAKTVAAAEATSDEIKRMSNEMSMDATIKRKEKQMAFLKNEREESIEENEVEDFLQLLAKIFYFILFNRFFSFFFFKKQFASSSV